MSRLSTKLTLFVTQEQVSIHKPIRCLLLALILLSIGLESITEEIMQELQSVAEMVFGGPLTIYIGNYEFRDCAFFR